MTDKGEVFLENRIFPLLNVQVDSETSKVTSQYMGTYFLLRFGMQDIFVTAKHLLSDNPDTYNLYLGYNTPDGVSSLLKVQTVYVNNITKDTAFFIPAPKMKASYEGIFAPMKWLRPKLANGQGVLVYGFASSNQVTSEADIAIMNIQRTRFEGKVVGMEADCVFPKMPTYYRIDIPSPHGLSGSPVLVIADSDIVVAGYIIGEQQTNGVPVATAADSSTFMEIEELLINISRNSR